MPRPGWRTPAGSWRWTWKRAGQDSSGSPARTVLADPYGDFSPGRWLWFLADVQPCNPPAPARGAQGLWNWEPQEEEDEENQVPALAPAKNPTAEEQEVNSWT